jgi:hypothetical protein
MRLAFALASLALVAGCGDSAITNGKDMAMPDFAMALPDLSTLPDFAMAKDLTAPPIDSAGLQCGNATCAANQLCCYQQIPDAGISAMCASSCPDGGIATTCDGPEDCMPNAKYCCAKIDIGPGNPPNCPVNSASANCAASCPATFLLMCPAMDQVRLCHQTADCADDPNNGNCCTYSPPGGASVEFCASAFVAAGIKMAGGTCTP